MREYDVLIGAIVLQAARDYVFHRQYMKDHRREYEELKKVYLDGRGAPKRIQYKMWRYRNAEQQVRDCESFFRSEWFKVLAPGYDGNEVIQRLRRTTYTQFKKRTTKGMEE